MAKYRIGMRKWDALRNLSPKIIEVSELGTFDFEIIITTSENLASTEISAIQKKLPFLEVTKIE